jgi:hypothetical protein
MPPFTSDIAESVIHMQNLKHPREKKRTEDSLFSPMKSNLIRNAANPLRGVTHFVS